jgi:hypothetical protein
MSIMGDILGKIQDKNYKTLEISSSRVALYQIVKVDNGKSGKQKIEHRGFSVLYPVSKNSIKQYVGLLPDNSDKEVNVLNPMLERIAVGKVITPGVLSVYDVFNNREVLIRDGQPIIKLTEKQKKSYAFNLSF